MNKNVEKIILTGFGLIVLGSALTPVVLAYALSNWRFILLYPAALGLIILASGIFGKKS